MGRWRVLAANKAREGDGASIGVETGGGRKYFQIRNRAGLNLVHVTHFLGLAAEGLVAGIP